MPRLARIGTGTSTASISSLATTLTAGAAVGTTVIGAVSNGVASTQLGVSATDSKGNTWTTGTASFRTTFGQVTLVYARITTALVAGDTVTVSITNGPSSRWALDFQSFDDVTGPPTIDQSATTGGTTTTALSGGTTPATTSANELVIGAFCFGGVPAGAFTAGSGFSTSGTVDAGGASANRAVAMEWGYVTSTGAQTATGTLSAGSTYAGLTATFPVTAAAPDTTAPSVPASVSATADSATSVTVTWAASTDAVGVTSYRVRRDGSDLAAALAVAGTTFTDTTAAASTAYSYTVSAVDAAGNRSAESTAATVATPASSTRSGKARRWSGSAWTAHPVKTWDGSAWTTHPARGRDVGGTWVTAR